jgi:hypothetical protein
MTMPTITLHASYQGSASPSFLKSGLDSFRLPPVQGLKRLHEMPALGKRQGSLANHVNIVTKY